MRLFRLLLLGLFFINSNVYAQPACTGPGRSATEGMAVCGTLVFPQAVVPSCQGPDLPSMGCSDPVTSSNSVWYKFHCYQSGTLGFLITPASSGDDYDWEMMDITGHPPDDVYIMNLGISLNLSAITGPTGCTPAGVGNLHCAGGLAGSQFNSMLNITAGHDYLLMVTNWSNSQLGYNLSFNGTAVLTSGVPPDLTNVGIVGCDATRVKVEFSEDILCSSITAAGTEFQISNGTHVITGITSSCSQGANGVPYLIINLQDPLPAGNYTLTVVKGTDLNTLLNVCNFPMADGANLDFTVPFIPVSDVTGVSFSGCAPQALDITFSKPVWCNSVTPGGTEFSITPGNPVIQSVQSFCSSGGVQTDQLHIVLQNPLPHGNYQLHIQAGSDGNTFIDTCNNRVVATAIPLVIPQTTVAPVVQSVSFDECHPDKLVIDFDKPVNCASISPGGNEFSITPGSWPISSIATGCGAQSYTTQVTLTLQNPLPGGNFSLNVNNGSDLNTLSDTCFAFINTGYAKAFVTTQAPTPKIDSVQFDKCNTSYLKLFYNLPILCSSVSPDGSDFTVTGPVNLPIAAASTDPATCGAGYTNWILLQLASPLNATGPFTVHNRVGTDGNGIIDTCNAKEDPAEIVVINPLIQASAAFSSRIGWGCIDDTLELTHAGGYGISNWTWTFSDGVVMTGPQIRRTFPVATASVDVKLLVDNGGCNDSLTKNFVFNNALYAGFFANPADTTCINTPVNFTDTSHGPVTGYLWDFGDLSQFSGQQPPVHMYPVPNNYMVRLIVNDVRGCKDTAEHVMHITALPLIDFTGLRFQYCTDNKVVLTRRISPNIDSYVWDNGDGVTVQNKPIVEFTYPREGFYTVSLTGNDKYCGPAKVQKTFPVYNVPSANLGPDTVLCPGERLLLGAAANPAWQYNWNTGASTAQVYSDIFTRQYILTVDNHGCKATGSIFIKVLKACLIRVPGAFTPNNDGLNDRLGAMNADLCRNFTFSVYNRGGQLIFSTHNPAEGWNGRYKGVEAEPGVYVWILTYTDPWTGKAEKQKGTSLLLR